MIGRLCYCVSPRGKFVCGMLLCAVTLTQPARGLALCVLRVGVIIISYSIKGALLRGRHTPPDTLAQEGKIV